MKFFEVREHIGAPPDRVWAILTDAPKLSAAKLGIVKIEGVIRPCGRVTVWSESAPKRAFPLRVTEFAPPSRMVWSGGMPLGLFRGVRQFNLSATPTGTAFHMREEYSGLLLPLIWPSIPDLNPWFEKFAGGLKAMAER